MGKGKMNDIGKFCFNLERNVPFGVESSCIRAMNPWLRRKLRALVRKAIAIGGMYQIGLTDKRSFEIAEKECLKTFGFKP